jgi:hypothetical protein
MYSVCGGRHSPARVPPFGNLRVEACVAAHRSLSQLPTSFIASWYQGIHRLLLVTYPHFPKGACFIHEISALALRFITTASRFTSPYKSTARLTRRVRVESLCDNTHLVEKVHFDVIIAN